MAAKYLQFQSGVTATVKNKIKSMVTLKHPGIIPDDIDDDVLLSFIENLMIKRFNNIKKAQATRSAEETVTGLMSGHDLDPEPDEPAHEYPTT
jgi:hypothetical protein